MKLEYQFTFQEYLEASRISTKLETFSEVEFWTRSVLILGGGIVYIIAGPNPLWGYFIQDLRRHSTYSVPVFGRSLLIELGAKSYSGWNQNRI